MAAALSSRERMLRAIRGEQPDYVPCCFMIFGALRGQCQDSFECVERQVELGLDAMLEIPARPLRVQSDHADLPGLPVRFHPEVAMREWREDRGGERYPTLCKVYRTPSGELSTQVNKTEDWPYGDHVPFLDDYLIPRSQEYLINTLDDLERLRYLLMPPSAEDIEAFQDAAREAKEFAEARSLLVWGGWGAVGDMATWLSGMQDLILRAVDEPAFVEALFDQIASWNQQRMEVVLDAGVDLFIRRGWYESCAFWSPQLYRRFIFPSLRKEVALAHERGAWFGYIMTTGTMSLLDMLLEAGVDVLIGVDPIQGGDTDLVALKEKTQGKMALWGGINGFLTVERGSREEVQEAVTHAVRILSPGGGFILSPVDNVRDTSPHAWDNVLALIETWKRIR